MSHVRPDEFPSTQWPLVRQCGQNDPRVRRPALDELLRKYLRPLKRHLVTSLRVPPQRADDLLQGFIASRVLERHLVARADPGRGRFRNLLLKSLNNYVSNVLRGERAAARRGTREAASLTDLPEPADETTAPEAAFELDWARHVLGQAVAAMREECALSGRIEVWGIFEGRVLTPTLQGREPVPYPQLVEQYRLESAEVAANRLVTGKRMLSRHLRAVVAEYASSERELSEEMAELRQSLSLAGAKPRLDRN